MRGVVHFWSANPNESLARIGAGAWYSDRSRILVLVAESSGFSDKKLRRLVNVDIADILSRRLPAWTHWNWAYSNCFYVDRSRLGVTALCDSDS